jgi:hypothetical protein
METINQSTNSDVFPVARMLNTTLLAIVALVRTAKEMSLPEDYEVSDLNRAYVLLVDELENLYVNNPHLSEIKPEPFWKRYNVLKTMSWQILQYLDDSVHGKGQAHVARLDRLCIIADNETPQLSSEQLKLFESAFGAIQKYSQKLDDTKSDTEERVEDSWYISKYWLDYELNGTILINGVLKLKKTHIASTIDKLLEQAIENQDVLFTPKLPQTARNLSTVLSSAGFSPVLRRLFFPTARKDKVLFRPTVSFEEATSDGIETTELDLLLKALGAELSYSG